MPDTTDKILRQFSLSAIPSLPELLLVEMDAMQGASASLEKCVLDDLFLFSRILEAVPPGDSGHNFDPQAYLARVGHEKLTTVIRQSAARLGFARLSPQRLRFLKQLHLQSLLARSLSEQLASHVLKDSPDKALLVQQAGLCGLFLNLGALVLEQAASARYLELLQQSGSTAELLEAELSEFGVDHAQVGAALMQQLHVGGFCQDAVRYHHHEISAILDATPLVKIAWLANQLTDEKENPEALVWADTLFQIEEATLALIKAGARKSLDKKATTLGIQFSTTQYLPLPETEEESIQKLERKFFRQLRDRLEADNLIALVHKELADTNDPAQSGQALRSVLRLLFGPVEALLFTLDKASNTLECTASSLAEIDIAQLRICCDEERSQIAQVCLSREPAFRTPREDLSVIDLQVQTLLGSDNFCCEPIVDVETGEAVGVLVLGIALHRVDSYKKQVFMRRALIRELHAIIGGNKNQDSMMGNDLTANFERRINETIHEVNNPLGIIKNYLQLLSMKQEGDSKTQSEISFIKSEIDRVASILSKLKANPASDESEGSVNINRVVNSLVKLFEGSIAADKNIILEARLDPALPELRTNENVIRQVLTNLVKNAAEAIDESGKIVVKTAGNIYMHGKRFIQLTVEDNGPGIAADILDKLFSPGNTSKGGDHSGSGLAIVKSLVEELDGQISCQTSHTEDPENNIEAQDTDAGNIASGTVISILIPLTHPDSPGNNGND